ncbi:PepSY domain-containing protein [Sphingomonas sp. R1]|uniref:PepSY domain-containing protein n=1 Tax=Sphingomonas sp. R1 TaxID=399176 RepID=UPI0022247854|nr:PepSY domain-containing protein [Sphingomonas sp. R1]UYY79589.1 PepSY domain-containing protein [Sphingomonas sp. R1]
MRLHIGASKVHRWLALLIGAQAIVWFTSGLIMSLLPIDVVHGDHRIDRNAEPALSVDQTFAPVPALLANAGVPVRQLQHRMLLGRPVVEAQLADGKIRLLDARTAAPLPPIDMRAAAAIAGRVYRGGPAVPTIERVERPSTEYRGSLPAWRASFPDKDATRIYVSAETGRLTSVRTGTWRLYDFFWGLHIMDWTEHERFNTPWLMAFAAGGLVFGVAGAILLFMRWPRRRRRKVQGTARTAA